MIEILKKFFAFCDAAERRKFYRSIVLGVLAALFSALKLPAVGILLQAILTGGVTTRAILLSLAVMLVSVVGASLLKYRATALQTEGGYTTTANKRVQIAEHLRYLPMGYFNENSLGAITSVTTNTMDNLSGISTRVVMLVTEGIFSTAVMTLAVFCFDWRVGLLIAAGLGLYALVNRALQRKSEATTAAKLTADTAVISRVLEYIRGIAEVKSYALAGKYNRQLETALDENAAANIDMELKLQPLMWAQSAVAKLMDVAVAVLSLVLYTTGHMALLNCVMLCLCSFLLTEGLEQAGTQSSLLRVVDSLMRNFSFVFQNVCLFHDTVANNIRFGQPDAPMEKVIEAAKRARCHDFIMKLPQGYATVIGESGGTLSGGERQRLSIARAMMKDAPVIILDEATASFFYTQLCA